MRPIPPGKRLTAAALTAFLALAWGLGTLGQDKPAPRNAAAPNAPRELQKFLFDANSCRRCHAEEEKDQRKAEGMICRLVEFPVWDTHDKHKNAFKVLLGPRAKAMGEQLKISVTESASCVNCHGSGHGVQRGRDFNDEQNGVSCVACHGPYANWVRDHPYPEISDWQRLTRNQKETMYGMTDLWDPVTRATKCASCHIGNADEQKVVTHAMYAAGHPPLPGIETATFSDAQPRHWQYLREKRPAIQKRLDFNPKKRELTDLVAVSGIVALRETMKLYAAQARGDGLVKEPETHWPDFARFDCYACHHDLQVSSWRQARGFAQTPGRPPTPTWPAILVELGITAADPQGAKGRASQYEQKVAAFHQATGARPFGNRTRAADAAQAIADWADEVSNDLRGMIENPAQVTINGPMSLHLLKQLAQIGATRILDFDSARQLTFAFKTIYRESKEIDPSWLPDPAIPAMLEAIDLQFLLPLPGAGSQEPIEKTLATRLRAVVEFNPIDFRARFADLSSHLPSK